MIISTRTLGEDLKRMRESAWLTRKGLAETCGLEENTIGRIEKGRNFPSLTTVVRIVNAIRNSKGASGKRDEVSLRIDHD